MSPVPVISSAEEAAKKKRIEDILAKMRKNKNAPAVKRVLVIPTSPTSYHPKDVAAARKVLELLSARCEHKKPIVTIE